jgi:hypothetical protein
MVRDIIRTNQGSIMMAILLPLHRFRIWMLRYLLAGNVTRSDLNQCCISVGALIQSVVFMRSSSFAEDPFKLAAAFLPALKSDMGELCKVRDGFLCSVAVLYTVRLPCIPLV